MIANHMKQRSLTFTMKEIFNDIPFGPAPNYKVSVNNRLHTSLDRALDLYRESRRKTLKSLYEQTEAMKMRSPEAEADLEEVSASCGHFSFSLLEFGEQLRELLAILDDLQLETEERPNGRSWSWMKFWRADNKSADSGVYLSPPYSVLNTNASFQNYLAAQRVTDTCNFHAVWVQMTG